MLLIPARDSGQADVPDSMAQLRQEMAELRQEVVGLRRENAILRQEAGYWKSLTLPDCGCGMMATHE
jgi:hypothetical protein